MTRPQRVGLLFGGRSVEHEVSVVSARGVAGALTTSGFECVPIGVTGEGRWLAPARSREILDGSQARVEAGPGVAQVLAVEPGGSRLLLLGQGGGAHPLDLDVVFPLVHGWGGEDGRLQGTLELCGIPYVGAGVTGSAAAMDKVVAKEIFAARGLPQTRWIAVWRHEHDAAPAATAARAARELGFPVFVKPANGGSSVGVSRVASEAGLGAALAEAFAYDHRVVVEQGLDAREVECAVLGNADARASGLGEIVPSREFYDYAAKYLDGTSELRIPAPLDPEATAAVRRLALAAYHALGLAGFARVDFLLDRRSGRAYLNEINTLPGFTPISMFPKLWQAEGLAFPDLCRRLVELAVERWKADRALRTSITAGERSGA